MSWRRARSASRRGQPGDADEVGHDEQHRPALDDWTRGREEFGEVGDPADAGRRGCRAALAQLHHAVEDVQHVPASAARGDDFVGVLGVQHRADPVAVAREQPRQHGDELARQRALAQLLRTEVDRAGQVEHEPGGDLAVFLELAHVRDLQPRGDVPVHVAHVVVQLVLAQVGEVEAEAAEQRAVVALQHAVEAAQHGPLEPAQQPVGIDRAGRFVGGLDVVRDRRGRRRLRP